MLIKPLEKKLQGDSSGQSVAMTIKLTETDRKKDGQASKTSWSWADTLTRHLTSLIRF